MSGLYANPGQSNYGAAKAGIAAFTQIAAQELARYGVTANAIAPGAMTRLTCDLPVSDEIRGQVLPRVGGPGHRLVGLDRLGRRTGQVIEASGLVLAVAEGWHRGPSTGPVGSPAEVGPAVRKLLTEAQPRTLFNEVN